MKTFTEVYLNPSLSNDYIRIYEKLVIKTFSGETIKVKREIMSLKPFNVAFFDKLGIEIHWTKIKSIKPIYS